MANFCQNCGSKLKSTDKFCTKCGTPVAVTEQNKQIPISSENIQATVENLKETVGNVSTVVKEKAKQAVQQSQEYLQSEEFQNTKENVIEKAKQAAQYSKDIVQNEEFRNEQADALKEKAKQAQEYLKSEEFQNAKTETVNKTKGVIKNFFSCNINSNDDYIKAEKQRKYCLYTIFAVIAATIFLIPFYDEWYWYSGMWESIMHSASTLSIISKVFIAPVCIIAFIKYYIVTKGTKEYKIQNSNIQAYNTNINKKAMLIILVICIVCVPVVNKINDIMYHSDSSSTASSDNYSDLVEQHEDKDTLCFKMNITEYIDKYNSKLSEEEDNEQTINLCKLLQSEANLSVVNIYGVDNCTQYGWDDKFAKMKNSPTMAGALSVICYEDNKDVYSVRYAVTKQYYNNLQSRNRLDVFTTNVYRAFSAINTSLTKSDVENILSDIASANEYNNGFIYGAMSNDKMVMVEMTAISKEKYDDLKNVQN